MRSSPDGFLPSSPVPPQTIWPAHVVMHPSQAVYFSAGQSVPSAPSSGRGRRRAEREGDDNFERHFVCLRGVNSSLPRASNIRVRATGRRGRSFARLQLKISSWQGVKRRRELQIGTTDGLEVNCRAPGAARPWRVRGGNDASKSRARARCALASAPRDRGSACRFGL